MNTVIEIFGVKNVLDLIWKQLNTYKKMYPHISIVTTKTIKPDCYILYDYHSYFKDGKEDKEFIISDLKQKFPIPEGFDVDRIVSARTFNLVLDKIHE